MARSSTPSSSISPATTTRLAAIPDPSTKVSTIDNNASGFELYESLITVNPFANLNTSPLCGGGATRDKLSAIDLTGISKLYAQDAAANAFMILCRPLSGNVTSDLPFGVASVNRVSPNRSK